MISNRYADRFTDTDRSYSPCPHKNVVVDLSGGRRFVEGEVTDDILVRALCLDCGEYLIESEVLGAWDGEPSDSENFQLEADHDHGM